MVTSRRERLGNSGGMTHPSAAHFSAGLDAFHVAVSQLEPDDWARPSPCEGWTALDVLGHLGSSIAMGVSLLRGEQPTFPQAEHPGDLVEGEPLAYWDAIAAEARAALAGADLDLVMETPMGPRTVADRLAFPAIDLYVHAWDIGFAAGVPVEIPQPVIDFAHAYIDPFPTEVVRGGAGAFGPEVQPPSDASATEAFIAWTGRAPR